MLAEFKQVKQEAGGAKLAAECAVRAVKIEPAVRDFVSERMKERDA